jgi:hypothetical protein
MAALIGSVGLMAGLPLYLLLHLRKRAHAGWPMSIGLSLGVLGLTYGLGALVLEMRLFEGQVWQWL